MHVFFIVFLFFFFFLLLIVVFFFFFFFSSRRRHTRSLRDWSSDVCSSDLDRVTRPGARLGNGPRPGAAQARARRARPDRRVPHHLGRLRRHRAQTRRETRFERARAPRELRHVQVHVERGHHRLPLQAARQDDVPLSP